MPPADPNEPGRLPATAYVLRVRQSPQRGKVLGKDKDRKPLDPPPSIQLFVRDQRDPAQNYLQSPYYWMCATLWHETENRPPDNGHNALCGSICSSLHRLKDMDSNGQSRDGGFFVFGDLSCKIEGKFRLKVILYETLQGQVQSLAEAVTDVFEVFNAKNFPGMSESTFMSRSFGDQGVRLRIRKESRQLLKRPASQYSPTPPVPQSLPQSSMAGSYGHMGGAYASPMQSQGGYSDMDTSAAKRQRSANTSPTGYYERGPYGSLAPSAQYSHAYAYGNPNDAIQPLTGMPYENSAGQAYSTLPMYPGRQPDPSSSAAGYSAGFTAAAYPSPGSYYPHSTSGSSSGGRNAWSGQGQS